MGLGLLFFWAGIHLYLKFQVPSKEVIIYQGKKSQLFDFFNSGELYFWNQGLEEDEISYSVDPNRIQRHWPQIPNTLVAYQNDSYEFRFVGTAFTFHPENKQLTLKNAPKSM